MRDEAVTLTKAVGIILMVFAHAIDGHIVTRPIALFHMPLFFIMSGFCFSEGNLKNGRYYLWKKIKGIYIPYVKWCLLFLLLHNLFCEVHIFDPSCGFYPYTIYDFVKRLINNVFLMNREDVLLGGFWFLRTLFWSSLLLWIIIRYTKKKIFFVTGGLLFVCIILSYLKIHLPLLNIGGRELLATIFLVIGYEYKKHYTTLSFYARNNLMLILAIGLLGGGCLLWPTSMVNHKAEYLIPYIVTATITVLVIYERIKSIPFLSRYMAFQFIGSHTLEILTWHFIAFKIVSWGITLFYHQPIEHISEFPVIKAYSYQWWWLAYLFVGIVIPLVLYQTILKNIHFTEKITKRIEMHYNFKFR